MRLAHQRHLPGSVLSPRNWWLGPLCLVLGVLGLAAPALAQGQVLDRVSLSCDLPDCDDEGFQNSVLEFAEVRAGDPVDHAALDAAALRILTTGFFASADWALVERGGQTQVVFQAVGVDLIRRVHLSVGKILGTELRRRVFLRSGEPWTNDARLIERQEAEIIAYYEGLGYFGTQVEIVPEFVAEHEVDLHIRVDEGQRKVVDRIYVRGHAAISFEEVKDILLGELGLLRTFTVRRFEAAQEALLRRYRELGFIQARVMLDEYRLNPDGDTVDLFVEVREGTRWDIRFSGNRVFSRNELLESLTFYQTGFIDDVEIGQAVVQIQSRYETAGHFFADVQVRRLSLPGGGEELLFTINERQIVEISAIRFEGLEQMDPADLHAAIETREFSLLATGGYLQRSQLDQDVARVEAACRAQGFLQASVPRIVFVGDDLSRTLTLVFHVDEGPRTRVQGVELVGIEGAEGEGLQEQVRELTLGEGYFSPDAILSSQSLIREHFHSRGFPNAEVSVSCQVEGRSEPSPCTAAEIPAGRRRSSAERELACERMTRLGHLVEECRYIIPDTRERILQGVWGDSVQVRYRVEAGDPAVFGQVFVRGGFRTRRSTVLREMQIDPGSPYSLNTLLAGQSRVRAMGLFDSVRVSPVEAPPGTVDGTDAHSVVVQLEEASARWIEHRVTVEARTAAPRPLLLILSNEPTYRDRNLWGRAHELRLFANFDLDVIEPSRVRDREFRAGGGIRYTIPRLYLTRRQRDPWEARFQLAYRYDLLAVPPAPLVREIGFDARIREEANNVTGLFMEVALNVSRVETADQSDPALESRVFEPAIIVSIAPRITLDRRRDNPLNPNRGYFIQGEIKLADDLIGVVDSERFTKITTRASGYIPLGRGVVLAMNGRVGMAFGGILNLFRSERTQVLPLSERYALGGISTVRGFGEGTISSLDTERYGGDIVLNGNIELRYPFLRSLGLDGALFVDAGQLANRFRDLRLDGFRVSAGMGLRWVIAGLIPLVVDYGVVLDRQPGEAMGRFHFNVGYTF